MNWKKFRGRFMVKTIYKSKKYAIIGEKELKKGGMELGKAY